ncbi:hypothetical protein NIES4074_58130 [Cylindrospermum sp. NIES-4074]|nr:hypothetical protein NIES4074_58130 [Cylindrospermum sp. NIES-4074]
MKTLKKVIAGIFLITGLSILLLGTIDLVNPKATKEDKEGSLAAIVLFGLPPTAISTWIIWSLYQQHQQKLEQLNLEREQQFLRLLQQNGGEMTVTNFALSAQISIKDAKLYLDQKAKELGANFEVSDEKGVIYRFPK